MVSIRAAACNDLAWLLANCPDLKFRNPRRAVEVARNAVEAAPKQGTFWNTLGVAHYRAGDWKPAIAALEKSMALRGGGDAWDYCFMAMARWQSGDHDAARKWYGRAVRWQEKNKEVLEKDRLFAQELRHFRREAEEVLQLKKK
jgi:Flp pilus assembly protein TadD